MKEVEMPDIIKIEVAVTREIKSDRADLFVTIRGSSLVTGQTALNKAREVAQLVFDLAAVGVAQDAIQVQGVSAEVTSGFIGKSSAATYSLRVRVANLETLPDVIGVVTSQKNTRLSRIEWRYPDSDAERDDMMRQAISRAQNKARLISQGLGVELLGVRVFNETFADPEDHGVRKVKSESFDGEMMRARAVSSEELGLQVSHSKSVLLQLVIEYRVSGFAANTTDSSN